MKSAKIAEVLGYPTSQFLLRDRLQKIENLVTLDPEDPGFEDQCKEAEKEVLKEGNGAFDNIINALTAGPKEREFKIKRSEKGQRIKIKSASGKSFAFGPVWCDSVKLAKGIVLIENNREKLNMHGQHVGVNNPEAMSAKELCQAIAALM